MQFIVSGDQAGAATVPGANETIIGAGTAAMMDTYVQAFRYVWLSAIPFLAIAALGKMSSSSPSKRWAEKSVARRDYLLK